MLGRSLSEKKTEKDMETVKRTGTLPNMKTIFLFTDIIIPAIGSAIAAWYSLELLDKWEEKHRKKKAKRQSRFMSGHLLKKTRNNK